MLNGGITNLGIEIRKYNDDKQARIAEAISTLSNEDAVRRASAAVFLRSYMKKNTDDDAIVNSMAVAYSKEPLPSIREIYLESFSQAKSSAIDKLKTIRHDSNSRVVPLLTLWGNEVNNLKLLRENNSDEEVIQSVRKDIASRLKDVKRTQWSLVFAADALRKLSCRSDYCPIDLTDANLRSFSFAEQNIALQGADFTNANLLSTDFYDVDLREAIFLDSYVNLANFAHANLTGASFENAQMNIHSNTLSEREINACVFSNGTNFKNALLDGAVFIKADISSADFHNTSFSEAQFSDATTTANVTLPESLRAELEYSNPKSLTVLSNEKGRKLCKR